MKLNRAAALVEAPVAADPGSDARPCESAAASSLLLREGALPAPTPGLDGSCCDLRGLVASITPVVRARARRVLARGVMRGRSLVQELDDVTQDVLVALFADDARVLRRWDPERGLSFTSFVELIAEREVLSLLRRWRRRRTLEQSDLTLVDSPCTSTKTPEEELLDIESVRQLCADVARATTPRSFDIFQMLYIDDRDPSEVSQTLGISLNCVYAHQSRLRRRATRIAAARPTRARGAGTAVARR
jgi:RNA polymerase sigma factor (sigma-70 family)